MSNINEMKNAAIEAEGTAENLKAELAALEGAETVDKEAVKAKKADLRKANSELNKANKAVEKAEKAAEKAAEREAKKAEREAEKAEKAAKREADKAAKERAKAAKQAEREANRMPEQNDVRRPNPTSVCGKVWDLADSLSAELGQPTPIANLLTVAADHNINESTVKTQYARWRRFHGISGRVTLPKAETEADTAAQ